MSPYANTRGEHSRRVARKVTDAVEEKGKLLVDWVCYVFQLVR